MEPQDKCDGAQPSNVSFIVLNDSGWGGVVYLIYGGTPNEEDDHISLVSLHRLGDSLSRYSVKSSFSA